MLAQQIFPPAGTVGGREKEKEEKKETKKRKKEKKLSAVVYS